MTITARHGVKIRRDVGNRTWSLLAVLGLSALGVLADIAVKLASETERPLASRWFALGVAGYAVTAFGWVFALRHLKLAEVGHIYCVATMILLAVSGAVWFRESFRATELVGLVMGIMSIVLLRRFG